jgi:hypothetical protein
MSERFQKIADTFIANDPWFGEVTFPVWVGVKWTTRSYGGPEEGGWYYDSSVEYLSPQFVHNRAELESYVRSVVVDYELKWFKGNTGFPNRYDGGDSYRLAYQGRPFPEPKAYTRPAYE